MMEIIDCHIHPAVDRQTDFCFYGSPGSIKKQFEDLKRAGISKACGSVIVAKTPSVFDEVKKLNDFALSIRDRYPDFYIPGIQIHPSFPDESCREIERCCTQHQVTWIGELVGYLMGFPDDYASKSMIKIMKFASQYKVVVNFHCGDMKIVEKLCKSVPEMNFVLAHPGEREHFLSRINKVAELKNLYLDISGTGIDRYRMLKKAVDIAGYKKLLFGSDYPINNPAVYIHGVLFEKLSEKATQSMFADNFTRLIKRG
ncbi:MAG TPA: TatD family hydrolase [bacterium]|nr:TatD family hydrolase [bacterium]HOL49130.1 TatD family hydrolase [bacterium]HPO51815.1 TatD family hydrolase [bacterium]